MGAEVNEIDCVKIDKSNTGFNRVLTESAFFGFGNRIESPTLRRGREYLNGLASESDPRVKALLKPPAADTCAPLFI